MIKNYITGLDKLELTCISANKNPFSEIDLVNIYPANAENYYILDGFVLKKEIVNRGNYNLCYKIEYNQIEIGKLFTDFTFKNADTNYVGLYLNNFTLYRQDAKEIIHAFLATFDLKVRNVKAVDVYLDSRQNIRNLFKKYFYNPQQYHFLFSGEKPFAENKDCKKVITLNRNRSLETASASYYIGNKNKKQICIYNKSKEIQLHSHKAYITRFHNQNLSGDTDVYRYELRLTRDWIRENINLEWQDLFTTECQLSLLSELCLDFRRIDSNKPNERITRCEKVDFIDFKNASNKPVVWLLGCLNKDTEKTKVNYEKVLLKLIDKAFMTNDRKLFYDVKQLSITLNLYDFFAENTRQFPRETPVVTSNNFDSLF